MISKYKEEFSTSLAIREMQINIAIPLYPWRVGSRTPEDTKIQGCSSPYIKWHSTVIPLYPQIEDQQKHRDNCTVMRYGYTPTRMAIIRKTYSNKSWWGCRETGKPYVADDNVKEGEMAWRFLKMFNIEYMININIEHTNMWTSNPTHQYQPTRNEAICIWVLYVNIYDSIIVIFMEV